MRALVLLYKRTCLFDEFFRRIRLRCWRCWAFLCGALRRDDPVAVLTKADVYVDMDARLDALRALCAQWKAGGANAGEATRDVKIPNTCGATFTLTAPLIFVLAARLNAIAQAREQSFFLDLFYFLAHFH
jgi:hypothetical protein